MRIRHVLLVAGALGAALSACGGSSFTSDDEGSGGKSGSAGKGGSSGSSSGSGGESAQGGSGGTSTGGASSGSAGVGGSGGANECVSTFDCPPSASPCATCITGGVACPFVQCVNGACETVFPMCRTQCLSDSECPLPPAECAACPGGGVSCPSARCTQGQCGVEWSGCGNTAPCLGLACGEPCAPCAGPDCPIADAAFVCNVNGECTSQPAACMGMCTTTMDCPPPPPICEPCPGETCAEVTCLNGACQMICDPRPHCETTMDCPVTRECRACPDMSCAAVECIEGRCDFVCPL